MANQPKKYTKFVATAATATLVASAIVPVASAAGFSDVADTNSHAVNINALAEAGIIGGYPDGTFKPNQELTRGQVVKMLGKWVEKQGFEIPADYATKARFTDLAADAKDQELVKYAALVFDTGVFAGSNGALNAGGKITRENMALVLDRAFKAINDTTLVEVAAEIEDIKIADLNTAKAEAREAIQALRNLGISGVENFMPKDSVTRAQFATFLNKTINTDAVVELTVKEAVAVDANTVEVTLSDDTKHTVKLETALEANKATEIKFTIDEKEYTAEVTYEVAEVAVESVKAINKSTIEVKFNKEVEKVEDVAVVNASTGSKQYVKSIELSEDKKSASVTLYDALTSKTVYNVITKAEDKELTSVLNFVVGEAKTVELASQVVATNGKLVYKVLDENGLDITSDVKVNIESDKSGKFSAVNGAVTSTLEGTETAFLKLSVVKDGKVIAESSRATISAKAAGTASAFDNVWTVGTGNFDAEDFKAETSIALGATNKSLKVKVLDQYGEVVELNGSTIEYSSLDTSVAIIDKATGTITPRKEGKVALRAELKKDGKVIATKTVEVQVTAAAKFTSVELDKADVNVTVGGNDAEVAFKTLDQFGNEIVVDSEVEVKSADTKVATAVVKNNKVVVTGVAAGTTKVTVKIGNIEKTIDVTIAEFGTIADYKLEGLVADLKTKDDSTTVDINETEMKVSVYGKDANGTLSVAPVASTLSITDVEGTEVLTKGSSTEHTINSSAFEAGKTYTLTAKVGTLTVAKETFTVSENGIAPTAKLTKDQLTVTAGDTVAAKLADLIEFTSTKNTEVEITGVSYISDNAQVIASSEEGVLKAFTSEGTANVYVQDITVEVTAKAGQTVDEKYLGTFKIENEYKIAFNNDLTAPKLAAINTATAKAGVAADTYEVTFTADLQEALYYKAGGKVEKMTAGVGADADFPYSKAIKAEKAEVKSVVLSEDLSKFEITVVVAKGETAEVSFANTEEGAMAFPLTDAVGNEFENSDVYTISVDDKGKATIALKDAE